MRVGNLNALKDAMAKAGFGEYAGLTTRDEKAAWLFRNGLKAVLPIKVVRLKLGLRRTRGGLTIHDIEYVTRGRA